MFRTDEMTSFFDHVYRYPLPAGIGLLVQYMMFLVWIIWYTGTSTSCILLYTDVHETCRCHNIFAWKGPGDFCVLRIGKAPKFFAQGPPKPKATTVQYVIVSSF